METEDRAVQIRFLERQGFVLELVQAEDSLSAASVAPNLADRTLFQGMIKLAFETGDIDAETALLKEKGVRLRMDVTSNEGSQDKFNLFYDADGNLLQFIQKPSAKSGMPFRPCVFGILVPDASAAARWYVEHLGFAPGPTYGGSDLKVIFLTSGDFELELVQDKRSVSAHALRPDLDPTKVQGMTKMGFLVPDLDRLARTLKTASVRMEYDVTEDKDSGTRFMIVSDHDGVTVQLFANPIRFQIN